PIWKPAMLRVIILIGLAVASTTGLPAKGDDPDPIKVKLDKARATYEDDLKNYRKALDEFFDKREKEIRNDPVLAKHRALIVTYPKAVSYFLDKFEDDARTDGNKKVVDRIKAERKAFSEKGDLPKGIPASVAEMRLAVREANEVVAKHEQLVERIRAEY